MPLLRQTLSSLGFLSRLPVPAFAFRDPRPLARDVLGFPFAGVLLALAPAGLLLLARLAGLSETTAAILGLGLLVALTGALHEDGLADVADALGGHQPKDRALAIMKDSRIGAYGALALGFSLFLRVSLLAEAVAVSNACAALLLVAAAAASRGAMALFWASLPPAAPGGVAERAGRPSSRDGGLAALCGAAIFALPLLLSGRPLAAVLPFALAGWALWLFRGFLYRRIGGVTGDGLGAAQQIAEIALYLGFALAVKAS